MIRALAGEPVGEFDGVDTSRYDPPPPPPRPTRQPGAIPGSTVPQLNGSSRRYGRATRGRAGINSRQPDRRIPRSATVFGATETLGFPSIR